MAHQHMPKKFYAPHKNPLAHPPTYLTYGSLSKYQQPRTNSKSTKKNSTIHCSEITPPKIQTLHSTPHPGNSIDWSP